MMQTKEKGVRSQTYPTQFVLARRRGVLTYRVLIVQWVLVGSSPRELVIAATTREAVVSKTNDTFVLVNQDGTNLGVRVF